MYKHVISKGMVFPLSHCHTTFRSLRKSVTIMVMILIHSNNWPSGWGELLRHRSGHQRLAERQIWSKLSVETINLHRLISFQRSRGLSWSPSNYEELGWKRYFLMSEWDQNRTRASVAIDINARLYSVAIMYPLWLPHSHNMTDFCAFLTYFYHLSHTAVTVIIQTGPSRVPNLPHI